MRYFSTLILLLILKVGIAQTVALTQKQELFDKALTVMLPANFKQLTATEVAERYDPTNPPNYVFRGPESSINLAFSNSYQIAPTDEPSMLELVNVLKGSLEKSYPAMFWVGSGTAMQNGKPIGKMEFKSLSPENTMVYNLMYLVGVKNQLVIVNFNCECTSADDWVKTGKRILESIKVK